MKEIWTTKKSIRYKKRENRKETIKIILNKRIYMYEIKNE